MLETVPVTPTQLDREPQPPHRSAGSAAAHTRTILQTLVMLVICGFGFRWGMEFRRWWWDVCQPIRFVEDMQNAWEWGNRSADVGYLNLYSDVIREHQDDGADVPRYRLDYPPLRLLVFDQWSRWMRGHHQYQTEWQNTFEFNWFPLMVNAAMEAAAAIAVFLLVWFWMGRCGKPHGAWYGLAGALVLWFNPALLINSCGRAAWEVWILPFYLFAVLLACLDWWVVSGLVLAVGAMFKGQQLVVAPMFLLWAFFAGRPMAAVRWASGFVLGAAVVVLPWMLTRDQMIAGRVQRVWDVASIFWIIGIVAAAVMMWAVRRRWADRSWHWIAGAGVLAIVLLSWPAMHHEIVLGLLIGAGVVAGLRWIPWRYQPALICATMGSALLLCVLFFHGSLDWYRIGFVYGVNKFPQLEIGRSSCLAGILKIRYDWHGEDAVWVISSHAVGSWPSEPIAVTMDFVLKAIYFVTLAMCSAGISVLHRRRHPRWLVAIVTPWLLFYALSAQMHERYLLWAAGVGAVCVGASFGMLLLVGVISILSWLLTIEVLFHNGQMAEFLPGLGLRFGSSLQDFIRGTYPDIGWMVVLLAGVFLFESVRVGKTGSAKLTLPVRD